jgi:hypothetical protein
MTDNTMVNRIRSKEQTMIYNDRQHNGQQNKIKRTNNDLQWQTTQRSKELGQKNKQWFTMTENTMSKGIRSKEQTMIYNDRQHNGQQNKIKRTNNDLQWQTTQWSTE